MNVRRVVGIGGQGFVKDSTIERPPMAAGRSEADRRNLEPHSVYLHFHHSLHIFRVRCLSVCRRRVAEHECDEIRNIFVNKFEKILQLFTY